MASSSSRPTSAGEGSSTRPRSGTFSSISSGRLRSLSSGLDSQASTAQTSLLSTSQDALGYFGVQAEASLGEYSPRVLHTLVETNSRDANAQLLPPVVTMPTYSPALSTASTSNLPEASRSRWRLTRRSTADVSRVAESDAQASEATPSKGKGKFLRTLSDLGRKSNASSREPSLGPASPRLAMSGNSSVSSFHRPGTPGSPYVSMDPISAASSTSNVTGPLPMRVTRLRKISNMALRGRSRASTVSAGSSLAPSRAESPAPPSIVVDGPPPANARPANRLRSASEPLRSLVPGQFRPLPGIDYFDLLLPRELRLVIFETLVRSCEADLQRLIADGDYVGDLAKQKRWVGRSAGLRELAKCSHVSKTWQTLALDLQLWRSFELPALGNDLVKTPGLLRILGSAWALKQLDLTGMANLGPAGVIALADSLSMFTESGVAQNGLTDLTLVGACRSLTANALHYLVARSPHLRFLRLTALRAVTNSLFDVLAACVFDLRLLDVNRCPNAEAGAILRLAPQHCGLVDLRLAGLRRIDDEAVSAMGLAFPRLQRLDIRDAVELTNDGLRRFVEWPDDPPEGVKMVLAPPYDKPRRLTHLRHLLLSGCVRLSDLACDALQGTCPELVALELAGIGAHIQMAGLVALLKTTPKLRKLDLDHAYNLPDRVLPALNTHVPQLDHLVLSSCSSLSERGMSQFVKHFGTPNSHRAVLEMDNTVLTESMLKELVLRRKTVQEVIAIDCRAIGRHLATDVINISRPRRGVRGWAHRQMDYHDDERAGPKEMDESKTVLKTFGMLTLLDAADQARATRRGQAEGDANGDEPKRPVWGRTLSSRSDNTGCVVS